jgi:hypothetical protein
MEEPKLQTKINLHKSFGFSFNDEKINHIKLNINTYKNSEFPSLNVQNNKDLVPGQYEGGIKVWECSKDLCNFLPPYVGSYDLTNLKVLELGCGHGLPGLYFLLRNSLVVFQDFNQEILEKITYKYIEETMEDYDLPELKNNFAFINGDWSEFIDKFEKKKYKVD